MVSCKCRTADPMRIFSIGSPVWNISKLEDTLQQDSHKGEKGPKINDFNFTNFTQIWAYMNVFAWREALFVVFVVKVMKVISDIKVIIIRKFIKTINEEQWSATSSRSRNLNDILSHIYSFKTFVPRVLPTDVNSSYWQLEEFSWNK